VGVLIAAVAIREGVEGWQDEGCCAPATPAPIAGGDAGQR